MNAPKNPSSFGIKTRSRFCGGTETPSQDNQINLKKLFVENKKNPPLCSHKKPLLPLVIKGSSFYIKTKPFHLSKKPKPRLPLIT
jgi:hypothetical protein